MDIQINYILNLKPKKLKKITPDKVEELGGMELFQKLGIELDFITFKMLCDEYMAKWNLKDQVNQMIRVDYWLSILGKDTPLKGIKTKHIDNALDDLTTGIYSAKGEKLETPKSRSTNTTLRYRSVLSSLFLFAMGKKRRYIKKNPVDGTEVTATPNKIVRYLSDGEREALLTACKASSWTKLYLLVLLGITSGMRKSEMMNLTWGDIDFNKQLATLQDTKNGDPRVNAIPDSTMLELIKHRQIGGGLVFGGTKKVNGKVVPTGKPF